MVIFDLLKKHEGLSLEPYKCPTGHLTIGYGHNIEANPLTGYIDFYFVKHGCITQDMADYLLDRDIIEAGRWAEFYMVNWSSLSHNRKYVIISMIFNLGLMGYLSFKRMRKAIDRCDFEAAANEMKNSVWHNQVGKRAIELEHMMLEG